MPSGSAKRSRSRPAARHAGRGLGAPRLRRAAMPSIAPDEADQLALDAHAIRAIKPRLIGRVGSLKRDGSAASAQALQRRLSFIDQRHRSEEHTSELQSPYVISYAVF